MIAATHRNLEERVASGDFREDLFYRLNVFPIELPSLRERAEDIPLLARYFAERIAARHGRPPGDFSDSAIDRLTKYPWPGNVRELENVVERALILSEGAIIDERQVMLDERQSATATTPPSTLQEVERHHILGVLETTNWKVSGKGGAAEVLDLKPSTLLSRMKKLGIAREST